MKFTIRGKKLEVTDSLKSYIEEKIGRLDKYFENPDNISANVLMKLSGNNQVVEVTINTHGLILRGEESNKDLYASIDEDIDILERQVRKIKTKKERMNKDESLRVQENVLEDHAEIEGEVIKTTYYELKPMSIEDAKLKLEEKIGAQFLTYIDVDTNKVNVIYRLKDGKNFGIVEPEA